MFALTPTELHRLADQIRRAARHGQIIVWAKTAPQHFTPHTIDQGRVDFVHELDPPSLEITLNE